MDKITETLKGAIGGLFVLLTSIIGLLVLSQVVFGKEAPLDVIGNVQGIVGGFVGPGATFAGFITLVLIVGLLDKQSKD
jgi:predicted alternative tryptophan synthase beta-subunit